MPAEAHIEEAHHLDMTFSGFCGLEYMKYSQPAQRDDIKFEVETFGCSFLQIRYKVSDNKIHDSDIETILARGLRVDQ